MPYLLRAYRRFPVVATVTYAHWFHEGSGTVWNLSKSGWRLSGSLPLQIGDVCTLKVRLPMNTPIVVAAGIVRWVRGADIGLETLVMAGKAEARLGAYIRERTQVLRPAP